MILVLSINGLFYLYDVVYCICLSILHMFKYIDEHQEGNLREIIDTPSSREDIVGATDRWISAWLNL